ncbi:MAG TPA: S41 family peptidase [Gemmatimonadaceae bacterium]|nr:S41 family peptidase [Gemmatimonadaceae bacterium]
MRSSTLTLLTPDVTPSGHAGALSSLTRTTNAPREVEADGERSGVACIERLPNGVGYLALLHFAPVREACDAMAQALSALAGSDALVLDLRRCGGGDQRTAALLTSYLFDTEPMDREERYARPALDSAGALRGYGALARRYLGRELYLLTGPGTSTLAREFARNLERLRGAMVVEDAA